MVSSTHSISMTLQHVFPFAASGWPIKAVLKKQFSGNFFIYLVICLFLFIYLFIIVIDF